MTPDQLLIAGGLALGGAMYLRRGSNRDMSKPQLPAFGPRGPIYDMLHPMREPLPIGNRRIEFFEQHMSLRAMSGGYKTTVMAQMAGARIRAGRSVVVLTGGDSDQLEQEIEAWGGYVIRPHKSPLKFNAFEGTATYMAQGWAGLFPTSSEAKVYHSAFEIACIRYFQTHSRYSVRGLIEFIQDYNPDADPLQPDRNESGDRLAKLDGRLWKGMREGYVGIRLQLMEIAFGDWIGQELSVLHCVKQRIPIMFVLDSADDPDLNRFACALVWQAINYAVRQHGNFDVFVDELGRLPENLVGDQVRTWRRNKCHLIVGSHADEDFTPILEDLIHVQLLGQMVASATETRKGASEKTWGLIHPFNFGPHVLGQRWTRLHALLRRPRQGKFWLSDRERVQDCTITEYHPPRHRVPRWSLWHLNATAKDRALADRAIRQHGSGKAVTDKTGASPAYVSSRATEPEPPALVAPDFSEENPVASEDGSSSAALRLLVRHDDALPEWCREPWLAALFRLTRPTRIPAILWGPGKGVWYDEDGCEEWTDGFYKPSDGGPWRPRKWVKGHGDVNPYRELLRAAGGDPDPTVDHLCGNPGCTKIAHLEGGVSFKENRQREPRRYAAFMAAGWRQVKVEHYVSCTPECEFEHVRWRGEVPPAQKGEQAG